MFAAAGIYETSWFSAKFSCHSGRSSLLFLAASTRQLLKFAGYNEVGDSSGEATSRRSSCWNSMIVQGLPEERSLASIFLPIFWTDVAFDRWPTPTFFSALRRVF